MTKPQQPERHRSSRDPSDPAHVKARVTVEEAEGHDGGRTGPVPPDNQPGHHPEHEQDKPDIGA